MNLIEIIEFLIIFINIDAVILLFFKNLSLQYDAKEHQKEKTYHDIEDHLESKIVYIKSRPIIYIIMINTVYDRKFMKKNEVFHHIFYIFSRTIRKLECFKWTNYL